MRRHARHSLPLEPRKCSGDRGIDDISSRTLIAALLLSASAGVQADDVNATKPLIGRNRSNVAIAHDFAKPGDADKVHAYLPTEISIDEAGRLRMLDDDGALIWSGMVADSSNDGVIAWGRWANGSITGLGNHANYAITGGEGVRNSLYYVVGKSVPADQLESLKERNITATFSVLGGGVAPTGGEGGGASVTYVNSGELVADFGAGVVDISLDITVPSGNYIVSAKLLPISENGFAIEAGSVVEATGTLCVAGCTAKATGFFSGDGAQRAGVAYNIVNRALSRDINGVLSFRRN